MSGHNPEHAIVVSDSDDSSDDDVFEVTPHYGNGDSMSQGRDSGCGADGLNTSATAGPTAWTCTNCTFKHIDAEATYLQVNI